MNSKIMGNYGEDAANSLLRKNKIIILEKNFRTKYGEIDIIGLHNNTLIFYEVKSRKSSCYGSPGEAVTRSKISKIKLTSKIFISKFNLYNYDVRYDVIEVYLSCDNKIKDINIIENAF